VKILRKITSEKISLAWNTTITWAVEF